MSLDSEMGEVVYEPRFSLFKKLMKKKIDRILLVSNLYDRFLLEEDGHISDRLIDEYLALNLSSPPDVIGISNTEKALALIKEQNFDLIITMRRVGDLDPFSFGEEVKTIAQTPVVLLLSNSADLIRLPPRLERKGIDKIFFWQGDPNLFLTIIKLYEDRMNIDHDTKLGKVQVILAISQSIRHYSTFLPMLYEEIFKQTHRLIEVDTLNEFHRLCRMRARPKILLAETLEEGIYFFEKFKEFILGIFSDFSFSRSNLDESIDVNAGVDLIKMVKDFDPMISTLLMSSRLENRHKAKELNSSFIYKESHNTIHFLQKFILDYLGFGDFIFRLPDDTEVSRARNLEELEIQLKKVPEESILHLASGNSFSKWFFARGEFDLAYKLQPLTIHDFESIEVLRTFLIKSIDQLKQDTQSGTIVDFSSSLFGEATNFARIGGGSLGGKGRGLAFLDNLLSRSSIHKKYPDVKIQIPHSVGICTDEYDKFIEHNNLYEALREDIPDEEVLELFVNSFIPETLKSQLLTFCKNVTIPIAVRSSSLLEDSQFQPFAGIYTTYMLPNKENLNTRLENLCTAIKLVYASIFMNLSKSYIKNTGSKVEHEKMGVVLQEIVGRIHKDHYYPDFSGVAQSFNFYPFGRQKAEEGIAYIALGLGKIIADGGKSLRFSPKEPEILPQFSTPEDILKNSQTEFLALDLSNNDFDLLKGEEATLKTFSLADAENDGILYKLGAVYDPDSEVIRDGLSWRGPRVVNFFSVLKPPTTYPLAEIISDILNIGEKAFGTSVEIEFTVNLATNNQPATFYLLQIRPFVSDSESEQVTIEHPIDHSKSILFSSKALGNGIFKNIKDIIYVKPEEFNKLKTIDIAKDIRLINKKMKARNKHYLLIGYGRWGTRDYTLGIPVKWNDISEAKVIVETGLEDFNIDPSFGSHFFSNITGLNTPYLTISPTKKSDYINWNWLMDHKKTIETKYLYHIELNSPLEIMVDGKKHEGLIKNPYTLKD
ncbi:MAG: PEP/pyruvate-binding domain-containing protein [Candidatus Hodarchaeales archaeon]|jgi:hypothetical protein